VSAETFGLLVGGPLGIALAFYIDRKLRPVDAWLRAREAGLKARADAWLESKIGPRP
jgi:hypothetical protein